MAAGVTGPAIYRHFSGKDEILSTLFDEAMDRLLELAGPRQEDAWAELRTLVTAQTTFALGDRKLLSVYSREDRYLPESSRRRLHRRQRHHVDRWVDMLERCFPERSERKLTSAAYAIIGLLLSVAHWSREARDRRARGPTGRVRPPRADGAWGRRHEWSHAIEAAASRDQ